MMAAPARLRSIAMPAALGASPAAPYARPAATPSGRVTPSVLHAGAFILLLLALGAGRLAFGQDDEGALNLADLAEYPDALAGPSPGWAKPVRFRDLWDHPDDYRGRA